MAYMRENWTVETLITAQRLNNMEEGIEKNDKAVEELEKQKGNAGGIAQLGEDGKILESQLPAIKKYTVSKKDGCKASYTGTRLIMQGNIVFIEIDMTFASDVAVNTAIEMANISKMAPGKVVILNTVTNQGKSCYINIATDGSVTVVAIDSITEGDGIRTAITYFIGY